MFGRIDVMLSLVQMVRRTSFLLRGPTCLGRSSTHHHRLVEHCPQSPRLRFLSVEPPRAAPLSCLQPLPTSSLHRPSRSISAMGDYTIQISTRLIDQLARDDEKVKRKPRKHKPKKIVRQHEEPQDNAREFPSELKSSPAPGWPLQPPMYLPAPPPPATIPEVEAIRAVLAESEKIQQKVENQKAGMLQELNKRTKELHDKEFKLPYQNPRLCIGERAGCLECYKSNAQDPLKCAETVKRFEACVHLARQSGNAEAHL